MIAQALIVRIGDGPTAIGDVVAVADGAAIAIGEAGMARMRASRDVVDALVTGETLIYGLNTGLGHMRDVRVSVDLLRTYQDVMVIAHDGAIGDPLPARVVRAAMATRIAGLALGGAGASPAVAETLVAMLNHRVHPVVPATGSVGASDLMHMAAIALVATGLGGRAELDGEVMAGAEALRRAGITPLRMEPKDGLATISANGVSVGLAALVSERAGRVADLADLVVAVSMEAIHGNPSVVDPAVIAAKPVPGQAEAARRILRFLRGSDRCREGGPASVQDPLSFRVAPQVHGALREFLRLFASAVEVELNASDDNPFVNVAERRLISNGNFHPMVLALAADAVRPAVAHVGQLADRRMGHLWATRFQDSALATPEGMLGVAERGGLLLRYAGAARYGELRGIAGPVTLDIPPLDNGVEDHATNAPQAVQLTDRALDLVEDILAVELVMGRDVLAADAAAGRLGDGVRAALAALDGVVAPLGGRPQSDLLHAAVRAALYEPVLRAAEDATPA
jgi:histidine ammonia-lyase